MISELEKRIPSRQSARDKNLNIPSKSRAASASSRKEIQQPKTGVSIDSRIGDRLDRIEAAVKDNKDYAENLAKEASVAEMKQDKAE
jgi:hypothetical protein